MPRDALLQAVTANSSLIVSVVFRSVMQGMVTLKLLPQQKNRLINLFTAVLMFTTIRVLVNLQKYWQRPHRASYNNHFSATAAQKPLKAH